MSKVPEETTVDTESKEEAAPEVASSRLSPIEIREEAPFKKVGKVWEVIVIREGRSKNDTYYTRKALQESIPLWEGQEVAFYGWDPSSRGHVPSHVDQAFPDGTFANHAGHLKNVRGRMRESRYELVADFVCTHAQLREQLVEMWEHSRPPGFSIHAWGDHEPAVIDGHKVARVTEITETKELTIVNNPAAGGVATRLVAGTEPKPKESKMKLKKLREFVAGHVPPAMRALVEAMEEKPLVEAASSVLKEMSGKYAAKALEALAAGETEKAQTILELMVEMDAPVEEMQDQEDEMEEKRKPYSEDSSAVTESVKILDDRIRQMDLRESRSILKEALKEAKLPKVAEDRLRKHFADKVFTESEVDAEIKSMRELLSLNGGGEALIEQSREARHPSMRILVEAEDKFTACMELAVFGPGYNPDKDETLTESRRDLYKSLQGTPQSRSFKRLYMEASGDWDCRGGARRGSLTEAVSNTTFSGALGNAYTLKLQKDFNSMPTPDWADFVQEVSEETLLQRERVIIGGIGALPIVAEGATFPELGEPAEFESNYNLDKRGGIVPITEEAVLNDRIDFIRSWPDKLRNAALESEKTVIYRSLIGTLGGGAINSDTSYTGNPHYSAEHGNFGTGALNNANLVEARNMTKKMMIFSTNTLLNGAINNSVTTVNVDSASGIRADMYVRVGSEFMRVTDVTGNALTVERGTRGTTAAAHSDDDPLFSYAGMLPWEINGGFSMSVIVPTELEANAEVALASQFLPGTENNDVNVLYTGYQAGRIKIVSVDSIYLGGDASNWYTAAPWQVANGLEVGYLGNQRVPQLINQTQDTVGDVFLADIMKWKVRHRVGANNMFHEGRTGHIVP